MAVVSTVESLVKIRNHGLHELSEQQILDCNNEGKGCGGGRGTKSNGGTRSLAFSYIAGNKGLALRKDYPYTAKDGKCDREKEKQVAENTAIRGYARVRPATETELMATVTRQPVTVGVAFPRNILQFYQSGIFTGPCGNDNDHVVTVVGYGQEALTPYWIVRNTWGASWGEQGYIRMKRFADDRNPGGLCEIAKYGSYPTM